MELILKNWTNLYISPSYEAKSLTNLLEKHLLLKKKQFDPVTLDMLKR